MRVFLTGATGFVGRHTLQRLDATRCELALCLVRDATRLAGKSRRPTYVRAIPGDLTRPETYIKELEGVDVVVHLHGWWNNIDTVLKRYRLPQQVAESGKNVILVVPEGPRNAPDSFGGKFEDPGGFKKFIEDVAAFLVRESKIKTQTVGTIVLTGHSGAYHGISFALMRGGIPDKIREVYLFDALYGQTEKYAYWIDHYKGKMITVYTDSGGTKDETDSLMDDLRGWGIPYFADHETKLAPGDLLSNRLIFIRSDLGHDMVMHGRMQYRDYLKASGLPDR